MQGEISELTKNYEIIVVDKSDDDTPGRIRAFDVKFVRQASSGLGGALREGLEQSAGDYMLTMDGDLSHDPAYISDLLEAARRFDVVIGSRKIKGGSIEGWGMWRRTVSTTGNALGRILAGVGVSDLTSGYRVYRRKVIESIGLQRISSNGYAFQLEILWHCLKNGFTVSSVPIVFKDRSAGRSKLSRRDMIDFLLTALRLRFSSLLEPGTIENDEDGGNQRRSSKSDEGDLEDQDRRRSKR